MRTKAEAGREEIVVILDVVVVGGREVSRLSSRQARRFAIRLARLAPVSTLSSR